MTMPGRMRSRFVSARLRVDERVTRLLARRVGRHKPATGQVLIVPPVREGSLGDEAMIQAIASHVRANGAKQVGLLVFSSRQEWPALIDVDRREHLPGGLDHFGLHERTALATIAQSYDSAALIGADVLDGCYSVARSRRRLTMGDTLVSCGLRLVVTGFSFNRHPDPGCHSHLRRLSKKALLCLRDPRSYERLLIPVQSKKLVADTAFLLRPATGSGEEEELVNALAKLRESGWEFLACNLNVQVLPGQDPALIEQHVETVAAALAAIVAGHPEIHLLLVPHDRREEQDDTTLLRQLEATLQRNGVHHVTILPSGLSAAATKLIAGLCSAALTGRMHFAIACLGMGVPVLALPYQDKFEGLFDHFGLDGAVLDPRDALEGHMLEHRIVDLWGNRLAKKQLIQARLPGVQEAAGSFVDWIWQ